MSKEIVQYVNYQDTIKNLISLYQNFHLKVDNYNFLDLDNLDPVTKNNLNVFNTKLTSITTDIEQLVNSLALEYTRAENIISKLTGSVQDKEIFFNYVNGKLCGSKINPIDQDIIGQIFTRYTDPRFPVLQINGCNGVFTKYLVAAEPVFILDWNQQSVDNILGLFNPVYQNRLCVYKIDVNLDFFSDNIYRLPYKQFNFILIWDVVNFMEESQFKSFLTKLLKLVRPGGKIIFNYNNCNKQAPADLYNRKIRSYQTEESIIQLVEASNFIVSNVVNYNENIDWIEIKSSGSLYTLKKQSVLYQLFAK